MAGCSTQDTALPPSQQILAQRQSLPASGCRAVFVTPLASLHTMQPSQAQTSSTDLQVI